MFFIINLQPRLFLYNNKPLWLDIQIEIMSVQFFIAFYMFSLYFSTRYIVNEVFCVFIVLFYVYNYERGIYIYKNINKHTYNETY